MRFPRQEYWSGLPFPSPGDLPDPGAEPWSLALEQNYLPTELPRQPNISVNLGFALLHTSLGILFRDISKNLESIQDTGGKNPCGLCVLWHGDSKWEIYSNWSWVITPHGLLQRCPQLPMHTLTVRALFPVMKSFCFCQPYWDIGIFSVVFFSIEGVTEPFHF